MTCPCCASLRARIAELEEDNRALRREIGQNADAGVIQKLYRVFRRRVPSTRARGAARIVAALRGSNGRPMGLYALLEALPPREGVDAQERTDTIIRVWISSARLALGSDAIETLHGTGYCLSETGLALVDAILEK